MNDVDWNLLLSLLAEPFPKEAISWRPGSKTNDGKRAQALAYAEPRVYEDRLNQVCADLWGVSFRPWGESRIICDLTIAGITRSSTGEENEGFAPGTAAEAQAFKRACSKFSLGRYLYDIPISWVEFDGKRNRLIEEPQLAARFLPKSDAAMTQVDSPPNRTDTPRLDSDRAQAMHIELGKLLGSLDQYKFASGLSTRNKAIKSFTELTDAEAGKVWEAAKVENVRLAKEQPYILWKNDDDAHVWAAHSGIFKSGTYIKDWDTLSDTLQGLQPDMKKKAFEKWRRQEWFNYCMAVKNNKDYVPIGDSLGVGKIEADEDATFEEAVAA